MLQKEELLYLIQQKKKLTETTQKLDDYATQLLEEKRALLDEVDKIMIENLNPLKDQLCQIDTAIETLMRETGQDKLSSDTYGAYMGAEISVTITDRVKAWAWIQNHPQLLKKDILKISEINKLINDGVVPDPLVDGIDVSNTYNKVKYRRK